MAAAPRAARVVWVVLLLSSLATSMDAPPPEYPEEYSEPLPDYNFRFDAAALGSPEDLLEQWHQAKRLWVHVKTVMAHACSFMIAIRASF